MVGVAQVAEMQTELVSRIRTRLRQACRCRLAWRVAPRDNDDVVGDCSLMAVDAAGADNGLGGS